MGVFLKERSSQEAALKKGRSAFGDLTNCEGYNNNVPAPADKVGQPLPCCSDRPSVSSCYIVSGAKTRGGLEQHSIVYMTARSSSMHQLFCSWATATDRQSVFEAEVVLPPRKPYRTPYTANYGYLPLQGEQKASKHNEQENASVLQQLLVGFLPGIPWQKALEEETGSKTLAGCSAGVTPLRRRPASRQGERWHHGYIISGSEIPIACLLSCEAVRSASATLRQRASKPSNNLQPEA